MYKEARSGRFFAFEGGDSLNMNTDACSFPGLSFDRYSMLTDAYCQVQTQTQYRQMGVAEESVLPEK